MIKMRYGLYVLAFACLLASCLGWLAKPAMEYGPPRFAGPFFTDPAYARAGMHGLLQRVWWDTLRPGRIYVSAPHAGLLRTVDSGKHWDVLTGPIPVNGVSDFVVLPGTASRPDTLLVASGLYSLNTPKQTYSSGLYRSADGGKTWQAAGLQFRPQNQIYIYDMIRTGQGHIFLTDGRRIFTLARGSKRWDTLRPEIPRKGIIKKLIYEDDALWLSGNQVCHRYTPETGQLVAVAGDYPENFRAALTAHQGRMFALVADTKAWRTRLYRVGGNALAADYPALESRSGRRYVLQLVSAGNHLIGGGVQMYRFDTKARRKTRIAPVHADIRDGAGWGDTVLIAHDGGISRAEAPHFRAFSIAGGLAVQQCYSVAVAPDARYMLTACQDNGTFRWDGKHWRHVLGGDGGSVAVSRHSPAWAFAAVNKQLYRSKDSGKHWEATGNRYAAYDFPLYAGQKSASPYTGTWQIKKHGGPAKDEKTWYGGGKGPVRALGVRESFPQQIVYTKGKKEADGLRASVWLGQEQAGLSWEWQNITPKPWRTNAPALPTAAVLHPWDPARLWLGLASFGDTPNVMASADTGKTWTAYSEGLPRFPVNALYYDEQTDILFAGTDMGLYMRTLADTVWRAYPGFPVVQVTGFDQAAGTLYVATYGRGVWQIKLTGV